MTRAARGHILDDVNATAPEVIARYLRSEYVDSDAIGLLPHTATAAAKRVRPVLAIHSSSAGAERERHLTSPAGSRVEIWEGHGHYLHLEDPDRFVQRLELWCATLDESSAVLGSSASAF